MEKNQKKFVLAKKVANVAFGILFLGGAIAATHVMVFEPLFKHWDYQVENTLKVLEVFPKAAKGDQGAISRLEMLSHKDLSNAYMMLNWVYRSEALKVAGVDMQSPNAQFESVDLTKSNALILRAIEESSDFELMLFLQSIRDQFDDSERDAMLAGIEDSKVSETLKNQGRFRAYGTFDQATKERLKDCQARLTEKFSSEIMLLAYYRDHGFCTDTPPNGSLRMMVEMDKRVRGLISADAPDSEATQP